MMDWAKPMDEIKRQLRELSRSLRRGKLCPTCGNSDLEYEDDDECPWCIEKRRKEA